MSDAPVWQPTSDAIADSNMDRFRAYVNSSYSQSLKDYNDLYAWSITQPEQSWQAVWDFCGVTASVDATHVMQHGQSMRETKWFVGAKLNYAENCLQRCDDHAAIIFRGEDGSRRALSYQALYEQVSQVAQYLRSNGVKPHDRVAGYLPNTIETIVIMLATASVGATWSSCSPDFGAQGVVDRFGQIEPKLLFTVAGYQYNGKQIDLRDKVATIQSALPTVQHTISIPFLSYDCLPNTTRYTDILDNYSPNTIDFEQLPFDHPLYILYSSGTTGQPKCIVHGAGGSLLQHLKEHQLHTDLRAEDVFFFFTTCGWMMWNWLVSGLATGSTLLLYDGAPLAPEPQHLIEIAAQEGVSIFGTSAKYLSAIEKAGVKPAQTNPLSALRAILSTGSPLAPSSFDYVYRDIKADCCLSSIAEGQILCLVLHWAILCCQFIVENYNAVALAWQSTFITKRANQLKMKRAN